MQIASNLRRLDNRDPRFVIKVQKLSRLGFQAQELLQEHFGQYGPVEEILLSGKQDKPPDALVHMRLRPSGFAFVLMKHIESVEAALRQGALQRVGDAEILVQRFERKGEGASAADPQESGEEVEEPTHPEFTQCG